MPTHNIRCAASASAATQEAIKLRQARKIRGQCSPKKDGQAESQLAQKPLVLGRNLVEGDNKGRGYELKRGSYVEIEPEELEAVEVESTRAIDIDKFVPEEEIDKRYYERRYLHRS